MAIQDRLKRDRYGLYNKRTLNKFILLNELTDKINYRSVTYKLKKHNIYNTFYKAITQPYTSHKYASTYNNLIGDYHNRNLHKTKSWTYIVNLMVLQYIYFKLNPSLYNNNFQTLAVSWYNISLFQMRKAIMKDMRNKGEIPSNVVNFNLPQSNGYYNLVKPMYYKHTTQRALKLYDLLEDISFIKT